MESSEQSDFTNYSKVVLFGSSGVGKRSFMSQIENGMFPDPASAEVERFETRRLQIKSQSSKETWIDLYLYALNNSKVSTSEQDLIEAYLFQCQCVLFFIDITEPKSFEQVKKIKQYINFEKHPETAFYLVANKMDLQDSRKISEKEIKNYIDEQEKGMNYLELSIKKDTGFQELIDRIYESIHNKENKIPGNVIEKFTLSASKANQIFSKTLNTFRVVMIGDSSVGKTAFSNRYFRNEFKEYFMSTIGISDESVHIKIGGEVNKLTIWDTAGQERFRSLPKTYYQNADGIFILFDVTDKKSFDNLESGWMTEIHERAKKQDSEDSRFTVYLVGNKADIIDKRTVSKALAMEKAKKLGLKYFETSCKLNLNITEVINNMIADLYAKNNEGRDVFTLEEKKKGEKKGCCGGGEEKKKK